MQNRFAKVFKQEMKRRGYVQADMAALLEQTKSSIGYYKNGEREPSFDTLIKIAQIFDCSLDYLVTGREYGEKENPNDWYRPLITEVC